MFMCLEKINFATVGQMSEWHHVVAVAVVVVDVVASGLAIVVEALQLVDAVVGAGTELHKLVELFVQELQLHKVQVVACSKAVAMLEVVAYTHPYVLRRWLFQVPTYFHTQVAHSW